LDSYQTPANQQQFEIDIKRSRFITTVNCVNDKAGGKQFIHSVRGVFPDANHHCWAMVAGLPTDVYQQDQSDDGEPKGTAGKPMLNVLQHSGIGNVVVVVTRYFGGVKLGAGGLGRAYTQSVSGALSQLVTVEKFIQYKWLLQVPYSLFDTLEHKHAGTNIHFGDKLFDQLVHVELLVPESENQSLETLLSNLGGGAIQYKRVDDSVST